MSDFLANVLTDQSGKFNHRDDFANLKLDDNFEGYDFEDTYDGLGDQLEEDGDDFNDDTFGDSSVGKNFDFSGKTAKVSETLEEEHLAFQRRPSPRSIEIDRSVYPVVQRIRQQQPASNVPSAWNLHSQRPNAVWAQSSTAGPVHSTQHLPTLPGMSVPPQARKFQTLEEVEASMLSSGQPSHSSFPTNYGAPLPHFEQAARPFIQKPIIPTNVDRAPQAFGSSQIGNNMHMPSAPISRQPPPGMQPLDPRTQRLPLPPIPLESQATQSYNQPVQPERVTASQKQTLEQDETALRAQQEKNLRRAQKIGRMARYNGIMSNGDKNYVLKVQISQLVSEDPEADDFYYTVHSTLRGRSHIQQSLGHFEQTYLSRAGQSNRRGNREKQNPMLKMQQQVQKIIASAKSRPKASSLAVEGSLGKLSFSRVRQPKQVLSVKMPEGAVPLNKKTKKEALQNIEVVYNTLLILEQTGRQVPPEQSPPDEVQSWKKKMDDLTEQIWSSLHIMDQVDDSQLHPFIQLLQYAKGKKLIPRVCRGLNSERRLTLITMIVAHLDLLDAVRLARFDESGSLPREIREDIDLFTHTVLPPLLVFTSSAPMKIVSGLLKMLIERNSVELISMSKIGLSFMTMFISRAEIAKQAEQADESELSSWHALYNHFFSVMEGKFSAIFPPTSHHIEEIYPWQFLAACAVSASPEQQHALVNEARDRVLDNVQAATSLPKELADIKRANVNLFLHAIGLDATQLEG